MSLSIEYIPATSPVHKLHALTKLAGALTVLTLSMLMGTPVPLVILQLALLGIAAVANVHQELLGAMKGLLKVAVVLIVLQVLFYSEGTALVPLFAGLAITDQGILFGVTMALRMLVIVSSFLLFLMTTPTRSTVLSLVEYLKVPYDYAFLFITALRFIPTFIEEVHLIRQAQEARAHDFSGGAFSRVRSLFPLALPLVSISLKRAERMAMAMETRGFGLPGRTHYRLEAPEAGDFLMMLLMVLAVVIISLFL
ncbi:energy-coupling factor transporter transmembrane component T family protein [Heliophilum fasciatum]|uniref:Energy-coupling factor transport system permease protein n=1 Tax=Heliophilum fasciatum TaxID=35700 RepID=A0A4R2RYB0_9FIRM|nr:energy-coupling factor transporter transmembrane component T [Heliophilum fasciatum]MCW2276956.1 energy-coupling factor transport system permease protein [Heliophilum fasciatum]TCP68518.1 energy-coupling factor transport system permease protein [Heliophilum fasciatum]